MPNSIMFNTAGSIALAVNYTINGPYRDKFLTKEADRIVRVNANFYVTVGNAVFVIESDVDLGQADLDSGGAFIAGSTYYVYAVHPAEGNVPGFTISLNSTYPSGYAAATSRKGGGPQKSDNMISSKSAYKTERI